MFKPPMSDTVRPVLAGHPEAYTTHLVCHLLLSQQKMNAPIEMIVG
jgi:hypothetical protein